MLGSKAAAPFKKVSKFQLVLKKTLQEVADKTLASTFSENSDKTVLRKLPVKILVPFWINQVNSQNGSSSVDAWVGCGSVTCRYEPFAGNAIPPGMYIKNLRNMKIS